MLNLALHNQRAQSQWPSEESDLLSKKRENSEAKFRKMCQQKGKKKQKKKNYQWKQIRERANFFVLKWSWEHEKSADLAFRPRKEK